MLAALAPAPRVRANDGACDPLGRFWIGTMALDEGAGRGALYRFDVDGSLHTNLEGAGMSNGLGWSGERMYWIDSLEQTVFVLDGTEPFVHVDSADGTPDGLAIDDEGGVWVARRLAPLHQRPPTRMIPGGCRLCGVMTPQRRHSPPELALARHGVVTTRALLGAGMAREAIRHGIRTGRLHPVYRGVYAVGRPDLTREGRWLAAVLTCGDDAVLSHVPAGLHWRLLERGDERPHVTVPTTAGLKRRRGITVHRAPDVDVVVRYGIPVTSLIWTLIDLAGELEPRALRAAVRQAELVHHLDLLALRAAVALPLNDFRRARLRRLLQIYVPGRADSPLEEAFLDLCRRFRLPIPQRQVPIGDHRADFLFADERLVIETDGHATHGTRVAFLDDRMKDRALQAAGYAVLRFTWAEIMHRPAEVAREIRAALRRRRRELERVSPLWG